MKNVKYPRKRANELKSEADDIIYKQGLKEIIKPYGKVYFTGSYFLDLMSWPDLDVELSMEPDPFSLETFFILGKDIAELLHVSSMTFYNRILFKIRDTTPDGLYWNLHVILIMIEDYSKNIWIK